LEAKRRIIRELSELNAKEDYGGRILAELEANN
jgi:hypothetical protein